MKKQPYYFKNLIQNANRFENKLNGTSGIKYYSLYVLNNDIDIYAKLIEGKTPEEIDLIDKAIDNESVDIVKNEVKRKFKALDLINNTEIKDIILDLREDIEFMLYKRNIVKINYVPKALFIAHLLEIGKTKEQIDLIINLCYQYNNISLDYFHIGTFKEFLLNLEYTEEQISKFNDYGLRKEVIKCLQDILECKVSLEGYTQNRDIRYGDTKEQLDFEEEAFKEDGKRMSEYTTADSYEITENYVCSYDNTITLTKHFLDLMGIESKNGFRLTLENGKELQIFDNLILEAFKNMRLMRIPGIETFATLIKQICINDGNLTKSMIDLFNAELGNIIKIIEDPECYKYIMMSVSDLDLFEYSDCKLLYTKICKILDLTNTDIIRLLTKTEVTDTQLKLINDILEDLDMETIPYYDDNLDYQEEDEECIPVMAE